MKKNVSFALVPVVGVALALLYALSPSAGGGQVSVPAGAFRPQFHGYDFTNDGNNVFNHTDSTQYWIAPVQLPRGATVTKLTFYWADRSSVFNLRADLDRASWDSQNPVNMATAFSSGSSGWGSTETTDITVPVIESGYGYYLQVTLPRHDTILCGIVIDYSYALSLPLILGKHP